MSNNRPVSFLNGKPEQCLPFIDRGFCYGHGVFETARLWHGECPLWDYHFARLCRGADLLGIEIDRTVFSAYWQAFLAAVPVDGVVKVVITAGEGDRGYRQAGAGNANYVMQWFPLTDNQEVMALRQRLGVSIDLCRYRLPNNPILAGIKHLNRLDQVLASAELDARRFPEGLVLDTGGRIIEGISRNVFLRIGEHWLTPDLARCGVAGVMRRFLLERVFTRLALPVQVVDIPVDRLRDAEEMFMCNSVSGIWPVTAIDRQGSFEIGEQTRKIQRQLAGELACFAA